MDFFVWKDNFSVHDDTIDCQHKTLIKIINDLYEGVKANAAEAPINELIAELEDYTIYHFSEEERILENYNSPNLDSQRKQHKFFIDELGNFKYAFLRGDVTSPQSLLSFLKDWLITHILDQDKNSIIALPSLQGQ